MSKNYVHPRIDIVDAFPLFVNAPQVIPTHFSRESFQQVIAQIQGTKAAVHGFAKAMQDFDRELYSTMLTLTLNIVATDRLLDLCGSSDRRQRKRGKRLLLKLYCELQKPMP